MPTVISQDGFRVRVLGPPREHPPPHVHVEYGPDGLTIIRLATAQSPAEVWCVYNMRDRDVVRAYHLVEQHHDLILAAWRKIHG